MASLPQGIYEALLDEELSSILKRYPELSFIKWSGLRLLMPAFEEIAGRGGRVRIITTSYMGASDAEAVEWLAGFPNFAIRVFYDTNPPDPSAEGNFSARAIWHPRPSAFICGREFNLRCRKPLSKIASRARHGESIVSGIEWIVPLR